jgi:hypothetical protein
MEIAAHNGLKGEAASVGGFSRGPRDHSNQALFLRSGAA